MNVNELRIGNFVDNNVELFQLQAKDLMFLLAFDNEHYANPVKLTEKWLLEFGFVFKDNKGDFDTYSLRSVEVWEHDEGFCHSYALGGDVLYVHQIQNLYFSLTGSELVLPTVPEATKPAL